MGGGSEPTLAKLKVRNSFPPLACGRGGPLVRPATHNAPTYPQNYGSHGKQVGGGQLTNCQCH